MHTVGLAPGPGLVVSNRAIVHPELNADLNTANVNWDLFPDDKRMLIIDQGGDAGRRRIVLVQNWPALARQMGAKP